MGTAHLDRRAVGWLAALALLAALLVLRVAGERGAPRAPASSEPSSPATRPGGPAPAEDPGGVARDERTPLAGEASRAAPDPGAPDIAPGESEEKPSLLRVRAIAPRDRAGASARVEVRDAAGVRVALLELSAVAPRAELACAPGEYELAVLWSSAPALGALPQRIVLDPGATGTVDFVLAALWRLSGRLTDERERGLADVPVALERDQRAVSEIRTLPDGGFVFPPLPEGDYALVLGDPLGPLVPRRILRLDGELGALEVRVPVLLELAVLVLDEDGLAVSGAEVEGVGEKGGRVAGTTDADGRLRAARLPPGNYRIFARHPTLGRGNRILALEEPLAEPLEIRLLTGPPPR